MYLILKNSHHYDISVDDCFLAGVTAGVSNGVLWSLTAVNTVFVTRVALSVVCKLAVRTNLGAEGSISHVLAGCTVSWSRTIAGRLAFSVAVLAKFGASLVDPGGETWC